MLPRFSEWVEILNESVINEVPRYGAAGAFGNKTKSRFGSATTINRQQPQQEPKVNQEPLITRDQVQTGNYQQAIQYGKTVEAKILDAARANGLDVQPSPPNHDKYLKIDGYWKRDGKAEPFSMKYRDTGNDVLFEVIKPYVEDPILSPRNRLGRDVKPAGGAANTYNSTLEVGPKSLFFLNKNGTTLSIIDLTYCYQVIGDMLEDINVNGWNQAKYGKEVHVTKNGRMQVQTDKRSNVVKVMGYLRLDGLKIINRFQVNIAI